MKLLTNSVTDVTMMKKSISLVLRRLR